MLGFVVSPLITVRSFYRREVQRVYSSRHHLRCQQPCRRKAEREGPRLGTRVPPLHEELLRPRHDHSLFCWSKNSQTRCNATLGDSSLEWLMNTVLFVVSAALHRRRDTARECIWRVDYRDQLHRHVWVHQHHAGAIRALLTLCGRYMYILSIGVGTGGLKDLLFFKIRHNLKQKLLFLKSSPRSICFWRHYCIQFCQYSRINRNRHWNARDFRKPCGTSLDRSSL